MPSSVPAAISYLYDGIRVLPKLAAPVTVSIGFARRSDTWLSIGVEPDDDETETEMTSGDLGANSDRESPELPCMIRARRVASDPNEAMRSAVTDAFGIFDAVNDFIRKDTTLAGAVAGNARIASYRMRLTNSPGEAGEGRVARIYFSIMWSSFL